jgi:hypothetical protein
MENNLNSSTPTPTPSRGAIEIIWKEEVDGEKTCQETVLIIYLPGLRVPPWMKGK